MWTRRLRYWWNRRQRAAALEEEIELHLREKVEELRGQGLTETDAREQARRAFGNLAGKQDEAREVWIARYWWELLRDAQVAVRTFRRSPWLTATIVLTLALTIGANTALFSVVRAVLFKPLPFPDADRLVWITASPPGQKDHVLDRDLLAWRERSRTLEAVAGFNPAEVTIQDGDLAMTIGAVYVSDRLGSVLGAAPALGRDFEPADFVRGSPSVALISDRLFRTRFAADPAALGKILPLEEGAARVIGVLPPAFRLPLPSAFGPQTEPDVVLRLPYALGSLGGGGAVSVQVIGRLNPGVGVERAQAELAGIRGETPPNWKVAPAPVRVMPLHQRIVGDVRTPLLILWLVTGFVLLVACANIANLLLARSSSRRSELAVCAALGAGRWRIVRALLTETLVLSFAGGVFGILLAWALVRSLVPLVPFEVPRLHDVAADWQVGAAAFAICTLTGLVCGLLPAFAGASVAPGYALKEQPSSGGRRVTQIHSLLGAGELALALLLLLGAGLCIQSLWVMSRTSALFAPEQVLVADVRAGGKRGFNPRVVTETLDGLAPVAESLPGITSAGIWKRLAEAPPPDDSTASGDEAESDDAESDGADSPQPIEIVAASPHLFEASGVRLLAGRGLDAQASDDGLGPAVVDQAYLRQFPGRFSDPASALGQTASLGPVDRTIVGVVSDFRPRPDAAGEPLVYLPLGGRGPATPVAQILVRTSGDAARAEAPLRAALARAGVTATSIETLDDRMSAAIAPRRFQYALLGSLAAIALLLALIGIYGVLNFAVTERTQEIGIRMALGASAGVVQRMVLARSAKIALAGIVVGSLGALGLLRLVRNMVYGVEGLDPRLFAAMSLLLGAGVLLAAYLPARRAAGLDPLRAIRHE